MIKEIRNGILWFWWKEVEKQVTAMRSRKKAEAESSDTTIKASPSKEIQNMLEATPTLRRSGRRIQFLARYRENAFITSMMNVFEHSSYREANQCNEWKEAM